MKRLATVAALLLPISVYADTACLSELTDRAAEARECQVNQTISQSCDDELRDVEIQRLTCLRDGADPERVSTAIQLGELMIKGNPKNSPANEWLEAKVAELVNVRLDKLMRQTLDEQVSRRLEGLVVKVEAQDDLIDQLDAAMATVEGRILQVASDMEFQFSVERDERKKLAERTRADLSSLEKTGNLDATLNRTINTIQERLKAIDASRASLNAELLKVQGQVNGLMLDRSVR